MKGRCFLLNITVDGPELDLIVEGLHWYQHCVSHHSDPPNIVLRNRINTLRERVKDIRPDEDNSEER
jgi:hypothetical protein